MNMDTIYERTSHVDWMRIRRVSHMTGLVIAAFAAGGWWHSINYQDGQRPYEIRTTHQMEQLREIAGPNPIATVKCERWATKVAKNVAAQAITVAKSQDPDAMVPTLSAVPPCPTGQNTASPKRKAP